VLHHMRDLELACSEMYRVLRPGGVFMATREHVISRESDLGQFLDQHPLHHLYGGEHAFILGRYVSALKAAGFQHLDILPPLKSAINLFPYTIDTLRDVVIEKVSENIPAKAFWRTALASDVAFQALLSIAGRFDNRPGRLYSFVGYKAT